MAEIGSTTPVSGFVASTGVEASTDLDLCSRLYSCSSGSVFHCGAALLTSMNRPIAIAALSAMSVVASQALPLLPKALEKIEIINQPNAGKTGIRMARSTICAPVGNECVVSRDHCFISMRSSVSTPPLERKTLMKIAKPTATSAAAIATINSANK